MQSSIIDIFPFSRLFLAVLLHFVWQATLIVMLVAIIRGMIGPKHIQARYLLSVIGLFAVLSAPLATVAYYISSTEAMATLNPPVSELDSHIVPVEPQNIAGHLEAQFQSLFRWFDNNRNFWLGCWMAGFLVLLGRLCLALGYCFRLRHSQQPLPPHLAQLAEKIKRKLNITHNVVVASSREVTQAVATGIIRPMVLVPAAWVSQLPLSAIEAILAHELAHIRRWDLWVNLLQRFTETVFFFHPLVWWLSRMISSEREICCDRLAINVTGKPMLYVKTLARVAGSPTLDDFELQFGTAFIGGKKMNLLRRAKMILEPGSVNAPSPFRTLALIVCIGLVVSYGSYAYCTTPHPAMASMQDHDHGDEHEQHQHNIHAHPDGNVEVIVVQERDRDESDKSKLHRHLVELLHGAESGHVDHQELAKHLRTLADHLEAGHEHAHDGHDDDHARKLPRARNRAIDVSRPDDESGHKRIVVIPDGGTKILRSQIDDKKKQIILELSPEVDGDVYRVSPKVAKKSLSGDGDRNLFVWRSEKPGPEHNLFIEKLDDSKGQQSSKNRYFFKQENDAQHNKSSANEVPFRYAFASEDDIEKVILSLKTELKQLRKELKQLRNEK